MITIFIGQRGTGKSSLLGRVGEYLRGTPHFCFDLDKEIEKGENTSIDKIFSEFGEIKFRELESKYFKKIISETEDAKINLKLSTTPVFISVGGGFDVRHISPDMRVVSLLRFSDNMGRIFLDRPMLEQSMSPINEYLNRYKKRKIYFENAMWEEYLLPEGIKEPSEIEKKILISGMVNLGGILTLLPKNVTSELKFQFFIKRRISWGIKYFEVRDDLLSEDQIKLVLKFINYNQILYARRDILKLNNSFYNELESLAAVVDYDRELISNEIEMHGNSKNKQSIKILSVHHYRKDEDFAGLTKELEKYERFGFHIKLAVEVKNFEEIKLGYFWQRKSPSHRSFLPRSESGKWLWYRLILGNSQFINFFREGDGSALDQPSLYQWAQRNKCGKQFAALLGSPVVHSYTPYFQGLFFEKWKISVLPIQLESEEFSFVIPFLEELGLVAAAVTSPLKLEAYKFCQKTTGVAQNYKSVNTIVKANDGSWVGHNTDEIGMIALHNEAFKIFQTLRGSSISNKLSLDSNIDSKKNSLSEIAIMAVWGGGGTLTLLKKIFNEAEFFSVQTGQSRDGKDLSNYSPEIVLWAGGRYKEEGTMYPPNHWSPLMIIDLNYRDDSGGKEFAKKIGAKYISGEVMFYAQGIAQQEFWSEEFD